MHIAAVIAIALTTFVIGAVLAFFLTRKLIAGQLKKNPPVNEKMIRAMFQQMGRTASEKQIRAVMRSMDEAK